MTLHNTPIALDEEMDPSIHIVYLAATFELTYH